MDLGQVRLDNQHQTRLATYQNVGYDFERRDKKILTLDIADDGITNPLSTATTFTADLLEPLVVDKLSDIYLDGFMTHNSLICHTGNTMAFSLMVNEFNINSNSASTSTTASQNSFRKILIPNDHASLDDVHSCVVHKGKKLNYVCSINPCRLTKLTGLITDLSGASMFSTSTNGHVEAGGKLYYVKLDGVLTRAIEHGKIVTFSANTDGGNFITAFAMKHQATDLYVYSAGGKMTSETIGTAMGNATVDGTTAKPTKNNTFRAPDFPRFIAEFIIVAR